MDTFLSGIKKRSAQLSLRAPSNQIFKGLDVIGKLKVPAKYRDPASRSEKKIDGSAEWML
jgi:hypothetical protein